MATRTNGNFGLNDSVKRAQFAKMIVGTLGITPNASTSTRFTDLDRPTLPAIRTASCRRPSTTASPTGQNSAQTLFGPWDYIHRDQVVSMIVRGVKNHLPGSLVDPPAGTPSDFY